MLVTVKHTCEMFVVCLFLKNTQLNYVYWSIFIWFSSNKLVTPNLQLLVWESSTSLTVVDGDASYLRKEHITPTQPLHSHH